MQFLKLAGVIAVSGLLFLVSAQGGLAQTNGVENISEPIDQLTPELDNIEKLIAQFADQDEQLSLLQSKLEKMIGEAEAYRVKLSPAIEDLKSQIEGLGPAPEKDAQPEAEGVAAERDRLNKLFGVYDSAAKKSLVVQTRAQQLIRKVQDARRELFADQILKRWPSPLSSGLWKLVWIEAPYGVAAFKRVATEWLEKAAPVERVFYVLIPCIIVWAILRWLAARLAHSMSARHVGEVVPFFHRASSALFISVARMVPALAAVGLFYLYLSILGTFTAQTDQFARSIIYAFSVFVVISAMARTLLAPHRSNWRLFALSDDTAARLRWLVQLIAAVYAIDMLWIDANNILHTPLSLTLAESFLASMFFALLLIGVLLTPFYERKEAFADEEPRLSLSAPCWPVWLKLPLWIAAAVIIIASTLGYISFANFLGGQIVVAGAVIVMAILIHIAIREFGEALAEDGGLLDRESDKEVQLTAPRRRQVAAVTGLVLNLLLFLVAVPLILLQWGFAWADIRGWITAAFFGFKIGPVELSLAKILVAVFLFFVGLAVTRMVQRWLSQGVLRAPPMHEGVAHSIRTGIGYIGFFLSAVLAFSYAGLNFTNLAIVAGALSVGIGFGLQSIVNNFVSGLILLAERPIRVGDWVVVGEHQGHVRRISVRATEIETFDKSSVIVPNSDLITQTVMNWTHGNTLGRVVIAVGVAYGTDVHKVHDLLLEVGRNHPKVLKHPEPLVVFEDFGASSLDFTLRVYLGNIGETLKVQTELRMAILEALNTANIEIPFPQRDVHIKQGVV